MPYYIRHGGGRQGPFSETQVVAMLVRGIVSKETEATLDEIEWKPLGAFPAFNWFQSSTVLRPSEVSGGAPTPLPLPVPPIDLQASQGNVDGWISEPVAQLPPTPVSQGDSGIAKKTIWTIMLSAVGCVAVALILVAVLIYANNKSRQLADEAKAAEQAKLVREAAEAQAAAKRANRERKEAEAKVALQAEMDRRDAEELAAAKAERERKEAEMTAAAEKKDQQRQEAAKKADAEKAAVKQISGQLAALPGVWEDISMPSRNANKPILLAGSDSLGKIKNDVKISYIPFIKLDATTKFSVLQTAQPHKIDFLIKAGNVEERIVEFSLKEDGIFCIWNLETFRKYNDSDFIPELNRFFLAKLRIEIDNFEPREIALWTPVTYTVSDFSSSFKSVAGRVRFNLWATSGPVREFITFELDNSPWLLDFDNVCVDDVVKSIQPKTFELNTIAYAPKLPPTIGSDVCCVLRTTQGKDLKNYVDFDSGTAADGEKKKADKEEEIKPVEKKLSIVQAELARTKSRINGLEKANVKKSQSIDVLRNQNNIPKANLDVIAAQVARLAEEIAWNNSTMNPDGLPAENRRLDLQYAALDRLSAQKTELQSQLKHIQTTLAAERKRLEQFRVDNFSIDLVKSDTLALDVHSPQNRLPLFRVVPDPVQ